MRLRRGFQAGFWMATFVAVNAIAAPLPGWRDVVLEKQYRQRLWNKDNGMARNHCNFVAESPDGYIWISYHRGLVRFDGRTMRDLNHRNFPELEGETFDKVAATSDGVWFNTPQSGLVFHLTSDGTLNRYSFEDGDGPLRINDLLGAAEGVWVATDNGVHRIEDGNRSGWTVDDGLRDNHVIALARKDDESIWVGTSAGLQSFDLPDQRFSEEIPLDGEFGRPIDFLASDDRSWLWITSGGSIHRIQNPEEPKADLWADNLSWPEESGRKWILPDHDGSVLAPLEPDQLVRIRATGIEPANSLPSTARCGCFDRENNLWITTDAGGLICSTPSLFSTLAGRTTVSHEKAWVVMKASNGDIWIGTDEGLHQIHNQQIRRFDIDTGPALAKVRTIVEGPDGSIWIGSNGRGMARFNNGRFEHELLPGGFHPNKIRTILPNPDGSLWIGSETGLHRWKDGATVSYTTKDGLAGDDVWGLYRDSTGRLWIGTYHGGLNFLENGRFSTVTAEDGFPGDSASTFFEDDQGFLWIGTPEGLVRGHNGRFATITTDNGLPDDAINSILEDDAGCFWIGTNRGIVRVKQADLCRVAEGKTERIECTLFDEADGMPARETNGQKSDPAGCRTPDGRLWFPTARGIAIIDPSEVPFHRTDIPVIIESVQANGRTVMRGDFERDRHSIGMKHAEGGVARIDENEVWHLPAGSAEFMKFDYSGIDLTGPEAVRYCYRLRGFDDEWIEVDGNETAQYPNLRPGAYRFEVLACDHHGRWSGRTASFAFQIAPHFYERASFITGSMLAGIALLLGGYRWRVGELNRLRTLQEEKRILEERTRMARDLHDGLGSGLTNLHMLCELVDRNLGRPEVAESHARELAGQTQDLAASLREIIWLSRPEGDSLPSLIQQLTAYGRRALETAGIRCREDVEDPPRGTLEREARQHVYFAVKEAVNNILKHAEATEVRVTGKVRHDFYTLEVHDNGRWVAKPDESKGPSKMSGHGLDNMRSRLETIGGAFVIDSNGEDGTTCRFDIPVRTKKSQAVGRETRTRIANGNKNLRKAARHGDDGRGC